MKFVFESSGDPEQLEFDLAVPVDIAALKKRALKEIPGFIKKWRDFQRENDYLVACRYWWESRWQDDHPTRTRHAKWNWVNWEMQKLFDDLWARYKEKMRGW